MEGRIALAARVGRTALLGGAELSSVVQLALRELPSHISAGNPALLVDIPPARRRDDFFRKLVDVIVGIRKRVARPLQARA
ncbi:MAG TPA: hypothetical protein VHP33_03565 [Polyangiaceae bacterium]|nr:hypothetical protein [Polyangiaceae bacterium]